MERSRRLGKPKSHSIPITGLSIFITERKSQLEVQHPELLKLGIFALLCQQWERLDTTTRARYERKADYSRRTQSRRERTVKVKKRMAADTSVLKVSPYSVFTKRQHEALKSIHPEMSVTERSQQIADQWTKMTKQQKVAYVNESKRETRKLRKISDDSEDHNEADGD
jgi:hypothetical protein